MFATLPFKQLQPGAILRVNLHKEHSKHRLIGEYVGKNGNDLQIIPLAEWRHGKHVPLMRQFNYISLKAPGNALQHDNYRSEHRLPSRIQVLQLANDSTSTDSEAPGSWEKMICSLRVMSDLGSGTWLNLGRPFATSDS